MRVLVVDGDPGIRRSLTLILQEAGYEVSAAGDGEDGLRRATMERPGMILTDLRSPVVDGLSFLDRYRGDGGRAPVVVMAAYGSTDLGLQAFQGGAADLLSKPFSADEVQLVLRKVSDREALRRKVGGRRGEADAARAVLGIVAESPKMARIVEIGQKVARHRSSVLIQGGTGTGKEVLARMIHQTSDRWDAPFVAVNCGAVPANLLESEFFGHVRGAFTGAEKDREGLFEAAHRGTLFLDEVGEVPESLQVSLLRVLQEGEIRRVGETRTRAVDVRILAATNRNLKEEVEAGRFREDLFYRLAVITLEVPSLRDRPEDIPRLVTDLLERHASRIGVPVPLVSARAMRWLLGQPWPGNVRELENALERALIMGGDGPLDVEDLARPFPVTATPVAPGPVGASVITDSPGDGAVLSPEEAAGLAHASVIIEDPEGDLSVKRRGASMERELIRLALARTDGHRGQAAKLLDLSRRALRYKMREYGLEDA